MCRWGGGGGVIQKNYCYKGGPCEKFGKLRGGHAIFNMTLSKSHQPPLPHKKLTVLKDNIAINKKLSLVSDNINSRLLQHNPRDSLNAQVNYELFVRQRTAKTRNNVN